MPTPARPVEQRSAGRDEVRDDVSRSRSRPKKSSASSASRRRPRAPCTARARDGSRPLPRRRRAPARRRTPRAACRARRRRAAARTPAPAARPGLHRPRAVAERLVAPEPFEDDAQVPVAHRVAEERKWLRRSCAASATGTAGDVAVVDVVVLGDHEALPRALGRRSSRPWSFRTTVRRSSDELARTRSAARSASRRRRAPRGRTSRGAARRDVATTSNSSPRPRVPARARGRSSSSTKQRVRRTALPQHAAAARRRGGAPPRARRRPRRARAARRTAAPSPSRRDRLRDAGELRRGRRPRPNRWASSVASGSTSAPSTGTTRPASSARDLVEVLPPRRGAPPPAAPRPGAGSSAWSSWRGGPGSSPSCSTRVRHVLVGGERLGLPARAVEREHQLPAEPLPERCSRTSDSSSATSSRCRPSSSSASMRSRAREPQLLEPRDLGLRERS